MSDLADLAAMAAFLRAAYATDAEQATTDTARAHAAAHRWLLADHHYVNEEDSWHTCAAATTERDGSECSNPGRAPGPCDCGRDERLERRLRALAAPYQDRPGYLDAWRTLSPEERAGRRW